jgi:serine/threonine protein kinase
MFEFDFKEWIARGGFADVYRAVRRDNAQEIAVKVLRDFRNPDCRRRFEREIRTLEALQGKAGIVPILGNNLNAEPPYYVMPLMKGGTLAAWAGKLDHTAVRNLLRHFADVLQHIHDRGGLHRDFKPPNVLVDGDGNLALGDFGLGNDPHCTVILTAHACGTPGYMAPELLTPFGAASKASDVYALGATIFELLTGVHPAQAKDLDPWGHNKAIPEDLRNMVLHMLQAQPDARPSTRRLLSWLGPSESPIPARVPMRWSGWQIFGGALAAVVLIFGFGALLLKSDG